MPGTGSSRQLPPGQPLAALGLVRASTCLFPGTSHLQVAPRADASNHKVFVPRGFGQAQRYSSRQIALAHAPACGVSMGKTLLVGVGLSNPPGLQWPRSGSTGPGSGLPCSGLGQCMPPLRAPFGFCFSGACFLTPACQGFKIPTTLQISSVVNACMWSRAFCSATSPTCATCSSGRTLAA